MMMLKIEEIKKQTQAFNVHLEMDTDSVMSHFKLNDLHLAEIEPEDIDHLEESNKKVLYIGTQLSKAIDSVVCSMPVSKHDNSLATKMPPKLNIKIQTLENLHSESEMQFLLDLNQKKVHKSDLNSGASYARSRNTSG
jgi:hypothetical protein